MQRVYPLSRGLTMLLLDISIFSFLNGFAGRSLAIDTFIVFFAEYFPYFAVGIALFLIVREGGRHLELLGRGGAALILSNLALLPLLQGIFARPRPLLFQDIFTSTTLFFENGYSFPSGHATFFFALATVLFFENKNWGIFFTLAATVISLARVMAGVHYPSDVLAGAVLGIGSTAFLFAFLTLKYQR